MAYVGVLTALAACDGVNPQPADDARSPDSVGVAAAPRREASAGAGPDASPAEPTPTDTLATPDGWGPLRIGMTRAQVVAAAGEDADPAAVGGPDPGRCDEFRPRDAPEGVLVMIEDGVLSRISIFRNRAISTPDGIRIGDAGPAVQRTLGDRARVEPHAFLAAPAKYITVWRDSDTAAERRGTRYEVDTNDAVTFIRVGGPAIAYVEGCV